MSQPGIKTLKRYNPTPAPDRLDSIESRVKDLEAKVLEIESKLEKVLNETDSASKSDDDR